MIILIAGDTHTGKTNLAQKLLEHYKKTYSHDTVPMVVKLKTWSKDDEFIGGYTELKKFFERS